MERAFYGNRDPIFVRIRVKRLDASHFPINDLIYRPRFKDRLKDNVRDGIRRKGIVIYRVLRPHVSQIIRGFQTKARQRPTCSIDVSYKSLFRVDHRILRGQMNPLFRRGTINQVLPVRVRVLSRPYTSHQQRKMLCPSTRQLTNRNTGTKGVRPIHPRVLSNVFFVRVALFPRNVRVTRPLLRVITNVNEPVARLYIRIVVMISFPKQRRPIVNYPSYLGKGQVEILTNDQPRLMRLIIMLFLRRHVQRQSKQLYPVTFPRIRVQTMIYLRTALRHFYHFLINPINNREEDRTPCTTRHTTFLLPASSRVMQGTSPPFLVRDNHANFLLCHPLFVSRTSRNQANVQIITYSLIQVTMTKYGSLQQGHVQRILRSGPSS